MNDISWVDDMKVIDTDSHVSEPADLWTSRISKKWGDQTPRVEVHPVTGYRTWRIADLWLHEEASSATAGWKEWPPNGPHHLDEDGVDPGTWNARERLKWMDANGIYGQVLYPNIVAFYARLFMNMDPDLSIDCIRAWNDFIAEFANEAPNRFIPIAMLPFWNVDECVEEMRRAYDMGHRGVLFGNRYHILGLPPLQDAHWDPVYASAQEMQMPLNFHVGLGERDPRASKDIKKPFVSWPIDHGMIATTELMQNIEAIVRICISGLCQRFPEAKFVSVESGFGYAPYVIESMDWHWKCDNGPGVFSDRLLPSEYFKRQCYGTFWFDQQTLPLLEHYPDNFMFETDYPHPTGMAPGPGTAAISPREHINKNVKPALSETTLRKVLHENAANLYRLS